jgi:hypothetical protein
MSGARSLKSDEVLGVQGVSKLTKLPEWKIRSRSFEDRTFPPAIDEERLLWTARRSSSISPLGQEGASYLPNSPTAVAHLGAICAL